MRRRSTLILLIATFVANAAVADAVRTVPVAVVFKLTDIAYRPLAGTTVRVVFDSDPDWRSAGAGRRVTTDANGEARFIADVAIDRRRRQLPSSNPLFDAMGLRGAVDHFTAGVELEDHGARFLYVVEASSREGREGYLDALTAYAPDGAGRFTRPLGTRQRVDLPDGTTRFGYGYEIFDYFLGSAGGGDAMAWTLQLAFKKLPPPPRSTGG